MRQIFSTQASWGLSGDLEAALSQAMLPETLAKIRKLLDDRRVDESIDADIARGRTDQVMRTPSVVIVKNGERRVLPSPDYATLKALLN